MTSRIIYRLSSGGFMDNGEILSCVMYWDEFGAYLGQEQLNCLGGPEEPLTIFFKATGNQAGEFGLTQAEMETAIEEPRP